MIKHSNTLTAAMDSTKTRLTVATAALLVTLMMSVTSVAGATPLQKPSKHDCDRLGYKNYGQCVKEWAHDKNHGHHGYGGNGNNHSGSNNNVSTNISVNQSHSSHNVVSIVINYFFGS
jgi:hypothetical protein